MPRGSLDVSDTHSVETLGTRKARKSNEAAPDSQDAIREQKISSCEIKKQNMELFQQAVQTFSKQICKASEQSTCDIADEQRFTATPKYSVPCSNSRTANFPSARECDDGCYGPYMHYGHESVARC